MKKYLVYIRLYDLYKNDSTYVVYKINTDNIYRVIGKIYITSIEKIEKMGIKPYTEKDEKYLIENGYVVAEYLEPKLKYD